MILLFSIGLRLVGQLMNIAKAIGIWFQSLAPYYPNEDPNLDQCVRSKLMKKNFKLFQDFNQHLCKGNRSLAFMKLQKITNSSFSGRGTVFSPPILTIDTS
jgi:hypothetical protein